MKRYYTNAQIYRDGHFETGMLVEENGVLVAAGTPSEGDCVVDLGGRHVVPGLIDVHVHLR
ncbi:MAG: dihydroorotase, partial [Alistipes sp.]|nr:dihydroorotase [Alistipes sp.]